MKICSKLSALGAVLVLSTAFASADTIAIVSNFQTQFTGYNANPANTTPTNNLALLVRSERCRPGNNILPNK